MCARVCVSALYGIYIYFFTALFSFIFPALLWHYWYTTYISLKLTMWVVLLGILSRLRFTHGFHHISVDSFRSWSVLCHLPAVWSQVLTFNNSGGSPKSNWDALTGSFKFSMKKPYTPVRPLESPSQSICIIDIQDFRCLRWPGFSEDNMEDLQWLKGRKWSSMSKGTCRSTPQSQLHAQERTLCFVFKVLAVSHIKLFFQLLILPKRAA